MFALFQCSKREWSITTGELDHRGKPEVICRAGSTEYCFRRGRRESRDVWLCWRRQRMFLNATLEPVGRTEGTMIAEKARDFLSRLEPLAEVYFDEE